jgi:hypothetical protein
MAEKYPFPIDDAIEKRLRADYRYPVLDDVSSQITDGFRRPLEQYGGHWTPRDCLPFTLSLLETWSTHRSMSRPRHLTAFVRQWILL